MGPAGGKRPAGGKKKAGSKKPAGGMKKAGKKKEKKTPKGKEKQALAKGKTKQSLDRGFNARCKQVMAGLAIEGGMHCLMPGVELSEPLATTRNPATTKASITKATTKAST